VEEFTSHVIKITKSVIEDNSIYSKYIQRYLTWMKLNSSQTGRFTQEILAQVEQRLDSIVEVALLNEEFITF